MDESKKKQLGQMVFLVILLAALAGSMIFMFKSLNQTGARKRARPAQETVEAKGPSSTNMPRVPGSAGDKGPGSKEAQAAAEGEKKLNENQFKVYALSPTRSPFVQEEGWYSEALSESLPGYPELKDRSYFDNDELLLPNMDLITGGDKKWSRVTMTKETKPETYEISGESADGMTSTTINMEEAQATSKTVNWSPASGVPLSALTVPGWEERYPDLASGKKFEDAPGTEPGSSTDLFGGRTDGGLGLPGEDGVGSLTTGVAQSDELSCQGVTINGGRASAILSLNGRSFLVSENGALPPRYKVVEVKANGVVLMDTRDESTKWVPLTERNAVVAPEGVTARPMR